MDPIIWGYDVIEEDEDGNEVTQTRLAIDGKSVSYGGEAEPFTIETEDEAAEDDNT